MLLTERVGPIAVVTLDRPQRRNALSRELMTRLVTLLDELGTDGTRGIVLTGGSEVFCAGADFDDLRQDGIGLEDTLAEMSGRLLDSPLPVVAAINGACVGGGVELAMSCDIRVCDERAFFEVPATKLGVLYRPAGLDLLASRLPHQTVARLFHVNDRIPAAEAVASGLVARVTRRGEAVEAALNLFDHQQDLQADVVAATKARLRQVELGKIDVEAWNLERERFMRRFGQ